MGLWAGSGVCTGLQEWDIAKTEVLVEKANEQRETAKAEARAARQMKMESVEGKLEEAQKVNDMRQKTLKKNLCEYEKRIYE